MGVSQTEQRNSCTLLRDGQPCNHGRNQRHQTVLVTQRQLLSLAHMMSHHEVSHRQAVFHGNAQVELSSAHINLYCYGHNYSVALLSVGILFLILPHNHDTTPTSRQQ